MGMRSFFKAVLCGVALAVGAGGTAHAEFPYPTAPSDPDDYTQYKLPDGRRVPTTWTASWSGCTRPRRSRATSRSTPARSSCSASAAGTWSTTTRQAPAGDTAWETTTGRPDVTIAVLDSGIKWNDAGAMVDLRKKTRLNRGEVPVPQHDRTTALEAGVDCSTLRRTTTTRTATASSTSSTTRATRAWRRIRPSAPRTAIRAVSGPADMLDPQDVLIAFTDGDDGDGNGFRGRHRRLGLPGRRQRPVRRRPVRPRHRRGARLDRRGRQRRRAGAPARTACRSTCASATRSSPTSTTSPRRRSTRSTTTCWSSRRRSAR